MQTHSSGTRTRRVDRVFRALSDPTRRSVVERLGMSPASVSDLADAFDMALPSFVQHLRILEESGVVRSSKKGRVRTYRIAPEGLRLADRWLDRQRALWERRLDQLDSYVTELNREEEA
jgi:DNA-binding transcriptional ArsR family regulator